MPTSVRVRVRVLAILCAAGFPAVVSAQTASSPVILGRLAGAGSPQRPAGLQLYGTDLGWTFEHDGVLHVLFGDSWARSDSLCDALSQGLPTHDDGQGYLPSSYTGGVPPVMFATQPGAPDQFAPIEVFRDSVLLPSGANATPMTGFSDGRSAIGVFQAATFVACSEPSDGSPPACPRPFECAPQLGECFPELLGVPTICDVQTQTGCLEEQVCEATGPGFCVDPTSSPVDDRLRVPIELELAVPRDELSTRYDSRFTFSSNKFLNLTARTVRHLADDGKGSDYRPGAGTLLMWGRPWFYSDADNNMQLYLMAHDLPFETNARGKFVFRPRYFAGLDDRGRPIWSRAQENAVPLALDGRVHGDPTELLEDVNQMAISWLGAPINRWVMLYGGGRAFTATEPRPSPGGVPPGSIAVRYAEHPWGPWTAPEPHLSPGDPNTPLALFGPGGWLYHPACVDSGSLTCARTDPTRFLHLLDPNCAPPEIELDHGVLYGANIIDAYTSRSSRTTLDVHWIVSTWNPYVTLFLRSTFEAPRDGRGHPVAGCGMVEPDAAGR